VVAMLPLPSRFFLLAFAVGAVALTSSDRAPAVIGDAGDVDRRALDPSGARVG